MPLTLGGLNRLVFAGSIGENAPLAGARICEGLGFLGLALNESLNAEAAELISTDAGRVTVRVIRTDEDSMIARSVNRLLETDARNMKTNTATSEPTHKKLGEIDAKDLAAKTNTVAPDLFHKIDADWRAANFTTIRC